MTQLNLIRFLDFYFTLTFVVGTVRRIGQYREIGRLIWLMPGRWPNLLELVKKHRAIFLTWTTIIPALLALLVMVAQLVASRAIWPAAAQPGTGLTLGDLGGRPIALILIVPLGLGMFVLDVMTLIYIGRINREALEKNFDQAEYWLKSKTAHVVRVFTLGFVNPRRMVNDEVAQSLVAASSLLNRSLWWVILQTGTRFAFGLSLWLTWASANM